MHYVAVNVSICLCVMSDPSGVWTEESIKVCLHLFLGLLPVDHHLIHDLANIYTAAVADIKRTILRVLETPVRTTQFVENVRLHMLLS